MKLKSVHKEIRKALRKNRKGGIEGLPLQLMIIIMIATLGTAIIVGWMGNIEEPQSIGKVVVDSGDIDLTGSSPVYSSNNALGSNNNTYRSNETVVITVYDQSGNPLDGATVVLTGLGVTDSNGNTAHGTTNDDGTGTFSNLKMKMTGHVGYITVEVSKSGYGEDSSCRITVIA